MLDGFTHGRWPVAGSGFLIVIVDSSRYFVAGHPSVIGRKIAIIDELVR